MPAFVSHGLKKAAPSLLVGKKLLLERERAMSGMLCYASQRVWRLVLTV
jgi:hypothetical protein